MNSQNILRELYGLIQKNLPKIDEDIKKVAEEFLQIIGKDNIIQNHFNQHIERINPLLKDYNAKHKSIISFYLKDFINNIKTQYKELILSELEKAIYHGGELVDIYHYTGALLSTLIDEGHSIEGLFSISQNIFIDNKSSPAKSFKDNFDFFKKIISRENSTYEIIFRLEGCKKSNLLPPQVASLALQKDFSIKTDDERVKSFLSPGQGVIFAILQVKSQDDRSAGIIAKKFLDEILDLIRFELEQELISTSPEYISVRKEKDDARIYRLPVHIPNPQKNIQPEDFVKFTRSIDDIFKNESIERESLEKIKSAFRFYRMGRDSEQFENKLLNWWTGLEYLVRKGEQGPIIQEVEKKLTCTLSLNYLSKHLESYKNTLSFCNIMPSENACAQYNISNYRELSLKDFFLLIKDQHEHTHICQGLLPAFPQVHFHATWFKDQIKDTEATSKFISRHEERLSWHIFRIYRTRCDIAHSAEYTLNLTLLCANLEYYLKSILFFTIMQFGKYNAIQSLKELFERTEWAYKRLKDELKINKDNYLIYFLEFGGL
jgi:hypothetical protein